MKIEKKYTNELLFSVYLYLFSMLKIITTNFTSYSTLVLFGSTIFIIVLSLFHNKGMITKRFFTFIVLSVSIGYFEFIMRMNGQTINYIYDYLIYGVVTVFLYSYVKNKEMVLKYYSNLSIIVFFVLFFDPFNSYRMTETYMVFGYSMLPAFSGMYLGWKYFNKKWMVPFIVIAFIQLIFFANRGAILTAIIIVLVLQLIKISNKKLNFNMVVKSWIVLFLSFSVVFLLWINAYEVVNFFYNILGKKGYFSYALFTLARTIKSGNIAFEMSTRDVIYDSAWEFINNNIFLGNGIGAFHDYYGIYTHNILLDILVTFGVLGILIFFVLIVKSLIKIFRSIGYDKLFGMLMLCLAIIPLWFSLNIFVSKEFWVLILIGFDSIRGSINSNGNQKNKIEGYNKVGEQKV